MSSTSSTSDDDDEGPTNTQLTGRARWLKKTPEAKVDKKPKAPKPKNDAPKLDESDKQEDDKKEEVLSMTPEEIREKLLISKKERGKVHYNPTKYLKLYEVLLSFAEGINIQCEVLVQAITTYFDAFEKFESVTSQISTWKSCFTKIGQLLDLIEKNNIPLEEGASITPLTSSSREAELEEEALVVQANLIDFIARLDQQYRISLHNLDPHLPEFLLRLQDEYQLSNLSERVLKIFQTRNQMEKAASCALIQLQYVYYKPSEANNTSNSSDMERLTSLVYLHADSRMKVTQALLYHIYFYALHGRYYQARDILLMTKLQENVPNSNHPVTMILFNRAMAQLGLCAFRLGLIKETHSCLNDLYSSKTQVKDLLAQGTQRGKDDQESYSRLVPFHMHINLDLLEGVYLTSALLLEVSNMAANPYETSSKKVLSKPFRNYLKKYEQTLFSGPPENTRENIFAAAKALFKGDWKKTEALLFQLPMWALVSQNPEQIKAQITKRIKEEALRTYLFTYGVYYESLSLAQLCQLFDLPKPEIHSIISRMLSTEELSGSWNQPSECLLLNTIDNPRFNYLSHQLLEKAHNLMEGNENLLQNHFGISLNLRDSSRSVHSNTSRKSTTSSKSNQSKTNSKQGNYVYRKPNTGPNKQQYNKRKY